MKYNHKDNILLILLIILSLMIILTDDYSYFGCFIKGMVCGSLLLAMSTIIHTWAQEYDEKFRKDKI